MRDYGAHFIFELSKNRSLTITTIITETKWLHDFVLVSWVSETEPELGLGKVISCDNRYVEIVFSAYKSTRKYASSSAPLRE